MHKPQDSELERGDAQLAAHILAGAAAISSESGGDRFAVIADSCPPPA